MVSINCCRSQDIVIYIYIYIYTDEPIRDLYILGLSELQNTSESDPLSYFQISGMFRSLVPKNQPEIVNVKNGQVSMGGLTLAGTALRTLQVRTSRRGSVHTACVQGTPLWEPVLRLTDSVSSKFYLQHGTGPLRLCTK